MKKVMVFLIFVFVIPIFAENYSLQFDGENDYVSTNFLGPTEADERTFLFWAKMTDFSSNNYILYYGTDSIEELFILRFGETYDNSNNGGWGIVLVNAGGWCLSTGITQDTLWHHYAVVLSQNGDLNDILFYQDGNQHSVDFSDHGSPGSYNINTGSSMNLTLGKGLSSQSSVSLNGNLDEFSAWNYALAQNEIQSNMNKELTGNEPGLVGYWNFNEGTGTILTDQTANGNDGTIYGATWSTDVPSQPSTNYSLDFDGVDDYVIIDPFDHQNAGSDFTIEFFIKFLAFDGDGNNDKIIDGDFRFWVQKSGPYLCFNDYYGNNIQTNIWYHIAATQKNGESSMFLDGQLYATGTTYNDLDDGSILVFGKHNSISSDYLTGIIDEVRLSNIVRYESNFTVPSSEFDKDSNTIGIWHFNEGEGTTISDACGNIINGIIHGATWSTDAAPVCSSITSSDLTWGVQVKSSQGSINDNDNYLGVATDATNGFDNSYDEVEPPSSPGSSIGLYFPHAEWNNSLGDNFTKDIRPEVVLTDSMQVWNFDVKSTDNGDVTLTFLLIDIPTGLPVILENEGSGERQRISNNSTYTFTAIADSSHPFQISIGDTTVPKLIIGLSCSGPKILISDSTHSLDWTTNDGFMIDTISVYFSSDSGNTYTSVTQLGDVSSYNWTVPDIGLKYGGKVKVKSQDYVGNYTEKVSDYVFAVVGDSIYTSITFGWNLWGAPVNPSNDTMTVNLNDDFTDYWVTYDYVNGGYTFDGILKEAEGYWLGAVQNATVDVIGTPLDSNITMNLSQGWNLISNPLVLDVSVDSLTFTKSSVNKSHADAVSSGWVNSIYGYDGSGYVSATTFEPWNGYWIGVLEEDVSMTFPIHRHDGSSLKKQTTSGWRIAFEASAGNMEDKTSVIGSAPDGSDIFDNNLDEVKPPIQPSSHFVYLSIPHPEWEHLLGDDFSKDIRSKITGEESKEWILNIQSLESEINLSWNFENVPSELEVGIDINNDGFFDDMRKISEITIDGNTSFTVKIGSTVLGISDDLKIPTEYSLSQNYPNPFNPTTTFKYELPKESRVVLSMFDMNGRLVETIVNQTQTAGYYSVQWDASSKSSGVYFYKISTGEIQQVKKCLLIK